MIVQMKLDCRIMLADAGV